MKLNHPPITIHDVYQSRNRECLHKFLKLINSTNKTSFISTSINKRDSFGRTLLHKLAASHQQTESLDWLQIISNHNLPIHVNIQDLENGWTPLHRALYHGNLKFAKALIDLFECDLNIKDHEGLLAFDLYLLSIGGPAPFLSNNQSSLNPCNSDLFTWGSNRNFLLGVQDDGDRHYPERIHLKQFNKSNHSINSIPFISNGVRFVAMSRLHTALITSEGELRVCGFGSGGRLGLTSNQKTNNTQDSLNPISAETQFTFAPVKGGGLANQRVTFVALGQDHTVVVTELGQVYTFGMNRFGQLGYAPESSETSIESMIQVEPKRVVGLLKKVHVIGAAASRWHTAVFSSDSLWTWGANRGQLGYPQPHPHNSSTAIQVTPRKVSIAHTSIIQLSCMNYETAYLCQNSREVYVLKSDITIRVVFPFDRFPSSIQLSTRVQSRTTRIMHINGSERSLAAVSSMGDVYVVDLEQTNSSKNPSNHPISSSPHRFNAPTTSSGPVFKPHRIWTSTNSFNAAKSAMVGMDGDLIVVTKSGDVYISYKKLGGQIWSTTESRDASKTNMVGMDGDMVVVNMSGDVNISYKRSSEPSSTVRKNYKFHKVPYLQRVSQVAASPTGSYAAIREDILLNKVRSTSPEENLSLSALLATMLPHLKKQATSVPELHMVPQRKSFLKVTHLRIGHHNPEDTSDVDEDKDILEEDGRHDELNWDARVGSALVGLSLNWIDHRLTGSLEDGDIFLVARSGAKVLAHRFILCCRSKILDQVLNGLIAVDGISVHTERADETTDEMNSTLPMLSFDEHSLLSLLLMIHYLYTDHFPCLWDDRVWPQIENMHKEYISTTQKVGNSILNLVNQTKAELKNLATTLGLPILEKCLERHGKATPEASLADDFRAILPTLGLDHDVDLTTEEIDTQNVEERLDHLSKSNNLNPDVELEMKDGQVLKCHSILLRAQCTFFRLIYDQEVWVKERRQSGECVGNSSLIRFDMSHLTKKVMQVVLQHVYTDDADELFLKKDFHSLNEYVDFVFDVMAVANELMMDKLKFICSVILRRFVNLLNVTAIAAEAEFYRADSLKEICMNHMMYNLEGIFQDSRGLSNIPDDLLLSLSNYLKKFQENQFPISRSSQTIDDLMGKYSAFLLELDLPNRKSKLDLTSHHWKSFAKFLAPSSHAPIATDLCQKNPPDRSFTHGSTEIANQSLNNTTGSHSDIKVLKSSAVEEESPDDAAPFVMDDVEAEVGSTLKTPGKLKLNNSSISDRSVWATPIKKVIPLDIRAVISTEKPRSLSGGSNLNRENLNVGSNVRLPSDFSTSNQKLSQREKRRQSAEASKSKSESTSAAHSNNQIKLPAWRSISSGEPKILTHSEMDTNLPPLVSSASPSSSPVAIPILGPNKHDKPRIPSATTSTANNPARVGVAKNSPELNDPASAIGAAIITPTRVSNSKATKTRQFSRRTFGGQDTPWTNYSSSCSNFIGPSISSYVDPSDLTSHQMVGSSSEQQFEESLCTKTLAVDHGIGMTNGITNETSCTPRTSNFSIIQEMQAKESWALYGPGRKLNRPNLIQIQEEENRKVLEKKQELQFLKWFEEESQRVQNQQQQNQQQLNQQPQNQQQEEKDGRRRTKSSHQKKSNLDNRANKRPSRSKVTNTTNTTTTTDKEKDKRKNSNPKTQDPKSNTQPNNTTTTTRSTSKHQKKLPPCYPDTQNLPGPVNTSFKV